MIPQSHLNGRNASLSSSPVHSDLPMTHVQDTQHTEPPGIRPVESPVNAQNVDSTPDIDKLT